MIQKEVADRLCALVGTKEYGQLTVFLNYFYDIKRCNTYNSMASIVFVSR